MKDLTFLDINNIIDNVEENFNIHSLTVNNEPVWQMLKMYFYRSAYITDRRSQNLIKPNTKINNLLDYQSFKKSTLIYPQHQKIILSKVKYLFFSPADMFTQNNQQVLENKYFNTFIKVLGKNNSIHLTPLSFNLYNKEFQNKICFYKQRKILPAEIKIDNLKKLFQYIKINFPSFDFFYTVQMIEDRLSILFQKELMFTEIIKHIKPELIFLTSYRHTERLALTRACRSNNIPVIDYQHGFIDVSEYSCLSKIKEKNDINIPDLFWVWGEETKSNITRSLIKSNAKDVKVFSGGSLQHFHLNDFERNNSIKKPIVSFFHQYTDDLEVTRFIDKIIKEKITDTNFIIKIHPRSSAKNYFQQYIKKRNTYNKISIDIYDKNNCFDLLKKTDLCVTCFSTVAMEANSLRIPTLIWGEKGSKNFKKYINNKTFLAETNDFNLSKNIKAILLSKNKPRKINYLHYDEHEVMTNVRRVSSLINNS